MSPRPLRDGQIVSVVELSANGWVYLIETGADVADPMNGFAVVADPMNGFAVVADPTEGFAVVDVSPVDPCSPPKDIPKWGRYPARGHHGAIILTQIDG